MKKRKPLDRETPLRRKPWMPARKAGIPAIRARERRSHAVKDEVYKAAVRNFPCVLWGDDCAGRIEAHHAGVDHGIGQKDDDTKCVPLCWKHHSEWTGHFGAFFGWNKLKRRETAEAWIKATQEIIAALALPDWA